MRNNTLTNKAFCFRVYSYHIVVFDTYCVVFFLSSSCVPNVARFSGLSILDFPFGFSNVYFISPEPETEVSFYDGNTSICPSIHKLLIHKLLLFLLLQNHCIPSHQTYHKCSSRDPEEVFLLFRAICNPISH